MDKFLCCKANTDYEDSYTVSIQSHVVSALGSAYVTEKSPVATTVERNNLSSHRYLTRPLTGNMKRLRRAVY